MDWVGLLIAIVVLVTVIAIVEWFMAKVPVPTPVRYIIYAVEAIAAISVVASFAGYGPHLAIR